MTREIAIKRVFKNPQQLLFTLGSCLVLYFHAVSLQLLDRLRFTFTPNGKREFVPGDQVFPSVVVY